MAICNAQPDNVSIARNKGRYWDENAIAQIILMSLASVFSKVTVETGSGIHRYDKRLDPDPKKDKN